MKKELIGALNIETGEDLMPDLLAKKERKPRGPVSEATKEKLRAKAKARHAAKLVDPNYKPKSVKVKKERKKKVGHLTADFGSLANFWKSGPKQEKKVRKKRAKFEKVRALSAKRIAKRAAQSAKRLEK